jgi:hypothetical protein
MRHFGAGAFEHLWANQGGHEPVPLEGFELIARLPCGDDPEDSVVGDPCHVDDQDLGRVVEAETLVDGVIGRGAAIIGGRTVSPEIHNAWP